MDKTWRGLTRQWFMIRRWTIQGCCQDREREMIQMPLPFRIALLFFPSSNSQICSFLTSLSFLSISKSAALIDRYCSALCREGCEVNKPHEESGILKWAINAALLGKGRNVSRQAKGDRLLPGQDWGGTSQWFTWKSISTVPITDHRWTTGEWERVARRTRRDFHFSLPPSTFFIFQLYFFFPSPSPCRNHLHSAVRRPQKRHLQSIMINSLHLSPFVFLPVKNHSGCMSKSYSCCISVKRSLRDCHAGVKTCEGEKKKQNTGTADSVLGIAAGYAGFLKVELFKDKDGFKFKDASVFFFLTNLILLDPVLFTG